MIQVPRPFRRAEPSPAPEGPCLNCHESISTPFCPYCGQENGPLALSIKDVAQDAIEEFLKVDSKLLQTLKPLFLKPGFLSKEWSSGRRIRYITPGRLYLTATFAFFLIVNFTADRVLTDSGGSPVKVNIGDTSGAPVEKSADEPYFVQTMKKLEQADQKTVVHAIFDNLPTALFFMLPLFALGLKLFYIRSRWTYVEHLVFALHNHAFVFLVMAVLTPLPGSSMNNVGVIGCAIYLLLAMKNFYEQSWLKTIIKSSFLGCGYLILLSTAIFGALFVGAMAMPDRNSEKSTSPATVPDKPTPKKPAKGTNPSAATSR